MKEQQDEYSMGGAGRLRKGIRTKGMGHGGSGGGLRQQQRLELTATEWRVPHCACHAVDASSASTVWQANTTIAFVTMWACVRCMYIGVNVGGGVGGVTVVGLGIC